MKGKNIIIFTITILTLAFINGFNCIVYANNNNATNLVNITSNEPQKKLQNDLLLRSFSPYIAKSIENYYGEPRQFALWDAKIINIKRLVSGPFNFEITISVTTFQGAHNPPYGLETVTIRLNDFGTHVVNFNHIDAKK